MTSIAQRKVIIGKEATPGDGATPTVALRAVVSLEAVVDKRVPDEYIGSFGHDRHYIASKMAEGSLEMPDSYFEHTPYIISMGLGAWGVSGTADPFTYTFTLAGTAAPTFATYRLEYTDGNNHVIRADDVFATTLEISGEAGGPWAIKAGVVGASVTFPAALGATLTPLATPTQILMANTTLDIQNDYDNFGTPNVAVLISFNWKLEGYMHQKQFAGSLYPTGRGNNKWQATLEVIAEIDHSVIESEKDKLFTTTQTAIQLKAAASASDSMTISGMYFLQKVDPLDERDGNNTVKLTYRGEVGSEGDLPNIVIVTNLSPE